MKYSTLINGIASALIILFTYTAVNKLASFQLFTKEMLNQPIPSDLAKALIIIVPLSELVVTTLLIFAKSRRVGFLLSVGLMSIFTGYVAFVLLGGFDRIPCSCGGIMASISWKMHLVLNSVFLMMALLGLYLEHKQNQDIARQSAHTSEGRRNRVMPKT